MEVRIVTSGNNIEWCGAVTMRLGLGSIWQDYS